MSEELRQLYSVHAAEQSKYVYFLLAATGAALGYALQKLDASHYGLSIWLCLLAILSWLLSFLFGCRHIMALQNARVANFDLLTTKGKNVPEATIDAIHKAIKASNTWAQSSARLQFWLLATGVVLFTTWRIVALFGASRAP